MAEREPKLETHEDAVNLVKAVFEQMGGKILADFEQKGGTILPPKRPLSRYRAPHDLDDNFMTTKAELLGLYAKMVNDGEGHMLHAEISECTRLKELYEERLRCLNERDPKLALVREGAVHLYDHYEAHFRMKIRANELGVEAATEVLGQLVLFCTKHQNGPLDVWYDCHECLQEVRDGPMPEDGRYTCEPLSSING